MIAFLERGSAEIRAVVKAKNLAPFKDAAKGYYLRLTLGDASGSIEAKIWDNAERVHAEIRLGQPYLFSGSLEEWQGTKSFVVQWFEPLESFDPKEFLPAKSEAEIAELRNEIHDMLAGVSDVGLRAIGELFFGEPKFAEQFFLAPAGKTVHHPYLGGLAEHSLEVAKIAKLLAGPRERELVTVGALLHDIGKIREYMYETNLDLTTEGKLFGHPVLGYQLFMERVQRHSFPENLILRLGHIIVSHHGERAWGAPVEPQTVEAAIVHYADLSTSRVARFQIAAAAPSQNGWTEKDAFLGRSLWVE